MVKSMTLGAALSLIALPCFAQPYPPYPSYPPTGFEDFYASEVPVGPYGPIFLPDTNNGPGGTVIRDGHIIGRDPDPFIRESLGRDYPDVENAHGGGGGD